MSWWNETTEDYQIKGLEGHIDNDTCKAYLLGLFKSVGNLITYCVEHSVRLPTSVVYENTPLHRIGLPDKAAGDFDDYGQNLVRIEIFVSSENLYTEIAHTETGEGVTLPCFRHIGLE